MMKESDSNTGRRFEIRALRNRGTASPGSAIICLVKGRRLSSKEAGHSLLEGRHSPDPDLGVSDFVEASHQAEGSIWCVSSSKGGGEGLGWS